MFANDLILISQTIKQVKKINQNFGERLFVKWAGNQQNKDRIYIYIYYIQFQTFSQGDMGEGKMSGKKHCIIDFNIWGQLLNRTGFQLNIINRTSAGLAKWRQASGVKYDHPLSQIGRAFLYYNYCLTIFIRQQLDLLICNGIKYWATKKDETKVLVGLQLRYTC